MLQCLFSFCLTSPWGLVDRAFLQVNGAERWRFVTEVNKKGGSVHDIKVVLETAVWLNWKEDSATKVQPSLFWGRPRCELPVGRGFWNFNEISQIACLGILNGVGQPHESSRLTNVTGTVCAGLGFKSTIIMTQQGAALQTYNNELVKCKKALLNLCWT